MKIYYDRSSDNEAFHPGDTVWYFCPRVKRGRTTKLARPWTGPYHVLQRLTDNTYRIQLNPRSKPRVVNRFHLWRCSETLAIDNPTSSAAAPASDTAPDEPVAIDSTSMSGH